jgi:hypothetical protein
MESKNNDFLVNLLAIQQDGKQAISAPTNWTTQEPLLEVATRIDGDISQLQDAILLNGGNNNIARWHFFIGSPGNGKSAAMGKLCRYLVRNHSCHIMDENNIPIEELQSTAVPYALSIYEGKNSFASAMIVQDASVVRNPFTPDVDPASELVATLEEAWERGISLIVCTNRGVLEKAYRERYLDREFNTKFWFKIMRKLVEDRDVPTEDELKENWDFNSRKPVFTKTKVTFSFLDNHSLLLGDNVFDRLVQKAINEFHWTTCAACEQSFLCPFKANRDWLADEDARVKFLHVLRRAEVLSGQVIVFREALAFLSLVLAGCPRDYGNNHPCQWVREKTRANDIFALAMRRIYMSVFASFSSYGLEVEPNFRERQIEAFSLLNKLARESNIDASRSLEHVVNISPPSIDVGVKRLTGPQGFLVEIDPWSESLSQEFLDKWDGNLSVMSACKHPLFTEIEKRCTQTWNQLEELIESTPSHEASQCYWALRRWSSNFLVHFGGLLEGKTCWGKELDEFIKVLETIVKDQTHRTTEEKRYIRDLDMQLEELLAAGVNEHSDKDTIPLSDTVKLSGRWIFDSLRPRIDANWRSGSLSIAVKFEGGEKAALGARAFIWLRKHLHDKLDNRCFPEELLTGVIDARIRASAKGCKAYAFADDDVEMLIDVDDNKRFKLSRFDGDVHVEPEKLG